MSVSLRSTPSPVPGTARDAVFPREGTSSTSRAPRKRKLPSASQGSSAAASAGASAGASVAPPPPSGPPPRQPPGQLQRAGPQPARALVHGPAVGENRAQAGDQVALGLVV